ncbi:MAG: hypothetical protein V3G42_10425 [Oscillospiraceae bacterium]
MELYQSDETKEEQKKEMESEIVMTNYHLSEFEKREEFVHADYEIVDRTSESADVTLQTSNADKLIAELETAERIVIELERLERKGFPAEQLEQFNEFLTGEPSPDKLVGGDKRIEVMQAFVTHHGRERGFLEDKLTSEYRKRISADVKQKA